MEWKMQSFNGKTLWNCTSMLIKTQPEFMSSPQSGSQG